MTRQPAANLTALEHHMTSHGVTPRRCALAMPVARGMAVGREPSGTPHGLPLRSPGVATLWWLEAYARPPGSRVPLVQWLWRSHVRHGKRGARHNVTIHQAV